MALEIMSATTSSSTSSFGCIDNFPKPPSSVHMRPSKSSISNSTNNLLPSLNSYPPMPHSEIDLKYIPIDPLYLPRHHPSLPFCLGEDISRMGARTRYIRIMAWDPTLAYISLCQDGTLSHYSHTTALPIVTSHPCDAASSHLPNSTASFMSCDPAEISTLGLCCYPTLHVIKAMPHLSWHTTQFQRLGLGYCLFNIDYLIQFSCVKHIGIYLINSSRMQSDWHLHLKSTYIANLPHLPSACCNIC